MRNHCTDDDDEAYSPDELQTMIEPTSYLAAKMEQAKAKHGPDSRVARAIEAACVSRAEPPRHGHYTIRSGG
jgi:hypothetical protein